MLFMSLCRLPALGLTYARCFCLYLLGIMSHAFAFPAHKWLQKYNKFSICTNSL